MRISPPATAFRVFIATRLRLSSAAAFIPLPHGRRLWKLPPTWPLLICVAMSAARAADGYIDYMASVKPILSERCYACHGAVRQEGGLRLDTVALMMEGGASGATIESGRPDASLLLTRITASNPGERMPAEGSPLAPDQVETIRQWIAQGAVASGDDPPETDPRDHWAFRPVTRPSPPSTENAAWVRNPIDAFVADAHQRHGLRPQLEAPPAMLARRLYLDLIGLPPTEQEWAAISGRDSEEWYERLVDQLLNDPRYGQRWARHWMDVWRYSDWWGLGDQLRNSHHHMWHWRDWIVDSLNGNAPYDEMIRLMLAADELHPNDLDKLRATGFLVRNWALYGRDLWMDETVEHVSKGMLGLTINCAKCHDHKYDPIEQEDYYRMRAFFEPYHVRLDMVPGEADLAQDAIPRVFDGAIDAPTYRFERGQETAPDRSRVITPGVPAMLAFEQLQIRPVALPVEAWQPERRPWVLAAYLEEARDKLADAASGATTAGESAGNHAAEKVAELAVAAARAELRSVELRAVAIRATWDAAAAAPAASSSTEPVAELVAAAIRAERRATAAKARHAVADLQQRLSVAAADVKPPLETELSTARQRLSDAEATVAAPVGAADALTPLPGARWTPTRFGTSTADDPTIAFPPQSTGRRSALAAWITDARNPLTARVAVNHLWARHFGTPLVASVFDFGRKGSAPVNQDLLDWLAAEFIDSGWDMKHLHKLIVMSAAYRLSSSSQGGEANLAKDPDNMHLWRRTPQRLEAEVVRDSILALAGLLDASAGGPPVPAAEQVTSTRRSLYFFHSNNDRNSFLTTFDAAGVKECYRRDQSIVPQQALAMSNSELVHDASKELARSLSESEANQAAPSDEQFICRAAMLVLGMSPSTEELAACVNALDAWRAQSAPPGGPADPARTWLVWALFNHNDFVTLR